MGRFDWLKKSNVTDFLKKIRTLRNGFKIILGYILFNCILLIIGYEEFDDFLDYDGDIWIDDLLNFGIVLIFIYWLLWGHKKNEF